MAESIHGVQVTPNRQLVVQRFNFFENVTQEKLFGELFATGLEVVNSSDDMIARWDSRRGWKLFAWQADVRLECQTGQAYLSTERTTVVYVYYVGNITSCAKLHKTWRQEQRHQMYILHTSIKKILASCASLLEWRAEM